MNARIKLRGDRRLQMNLSRMGKVPEEKALLKQIGVYLIKATTLNMDSEGKRIGERWKPLSEKYKDWRRKKGYTGKMLQVTGRLKGSLTYEIPKPKTLEWSYGSNAPYGKYHISKKRRTKIPERQFLGVNFQDKRIILKLLGKVIQGKIRIKTL